MTTNDKDVNAKAEKLGLYAGPLRQYVESLPKLSAQELRDELDVLDDEIVNLETAYASKLDTQSKLGPGVLANIVGTAITVIVVGVGWMVTSGRQAPHGVLPLSMTLILVVIVTALAATGLLWILAGTKADETLGRLKYAQERRRVVRHEERLRAARSKKSPR